MARFLSKFRANFLISSEFAMRLPVIGNQKTYRGHRYRQDLSRMACPFIFAEKQNMYGMHILL